MAAPRPFKVDVPEETLDLIQKKLALTRLPDELELEEKDQWKWGAPKHEIESLVNHWRNGYDWRSVERRINEMPQFMMHVQADGQESIDVHFVHALSKRPNAKPLLFVHGWPGNFTEVEKVLPLWTDPKNPDDQAFHVIAPSLPGFCFSEANKKPGFGIFEMAATLNQLMIQLGYERYIAQGGDWGSFVCRALARRHSDNCRAIHTNMFVVRPPSKANVYEVAKYLLGGYSTREIDDLTATQKFVDEETGYQAIQGTKPQTLNYALADSPVGQLAWIREKLYTWTDSYPWTKDEIITWAMLYYVNNQPATRIYKEFIRIRGSFIGDHIPVPVAVSNFPKEIYRMPQSWIRKVAQQLLGWYQHDKGGHFAATEQPEALAADLQKFVKVLRGNKAWVERAKF
ncbi:hypothetical protein PYCC9005_001972 [Savitreella phatthalungensis]